MTWGANDRSSAERPALGAGWFEDPVALNTAAAAAVFDATAGVCCGGTFDEIAPAPAPTGVPTAAVEVFTAG